MQKNFTVHPVPGEAAAKSDLRGDMLNVIWSMMRISMAQVTLAMIFASMVIAKDNFAQKVLDREVYLSVKAVTIKKVLQQIESSTRVKFVYSRSHLKLDERVSIEAAGKKLGDVLEELLASREIQYRVQESNDYIVLTRENEENAFTKEDSGKDEFPAVMVMGKITESNGMPIPGVSILVKETTAGTVTDAEGMYSINVTDADAVLVFSSIGYVTQEISVNERTEINVTMVEDVRSLDEIVVVGYGTQLKENITSSVNTISGEQIQKLQVGSFTEAMVGRLSGVQITQTTGAPGAAPSIRIRGAGSITAGNEPLYVIDGFPLGREALSSLNSGDIESISVLKDASATSIYGSRGANGVILVTTKRGKAGAPVVSFNSYVGLQSVTKKLDVLSADEFVEFSIDAINDSWEYLGGSKDDPNSARPPFYQISPYFNDKDSWVVTDWQDKIFQVAPITDNQLSVSGGAESIRYSISAGYFAQEGLIKESNFKRYSLRANMDSNPLKRLRISGSLNTSIVNNKKARDEGQFNQGIIGSFINSPEFYGTRNPDGSYPSLWGFGYNTSAIQNPMSFINEYDDRRDQYRMISNLTGELDLIKGMYIKSLIGYDYNLIRDNSFQKSFVYDLPANPGHSRGTIPAAGSYGSVSDFNWLWENTIHYDFNLGKDHNLSTLAGFTAQKATIQSSDITATNFPNNLVPTLNAGQISDANTVETQWSLLSYLARVNYSLGKKYFASVVLRSDGSSRFGANRKWGIFPSASLGWMVSNEEFFDVSWANFLKLRTSFGLSGNNAIPDFGSIGLLAYDDYIIGGTLVSGINPSTLTNLNLSWERSQQIDFGMDVGLFNDRVNLVFDVYQSINNDLLLNVPVPSILGVTNTLQNIGKVRNRGLEIALNTRNTTGRFEWSTDLNFSVNRNVVLALGPEGDPIISTSNGASHMTEIGQPIGSFFGYVFEGVYNTQAEIESRPHLPTDDPGSPIVKDVNDDGVINASDRTIIGNSQPDFIYGINNSFSFRNFHLSIQLQGVQGADVMNLGKRQSLSMTGRTNNLGIARERWRSPEEPGNGTVFKASLDVRGVRRDASTFYMEDGSYLRIRNISLGYDIPAGVVKNIGLSSARIYLSAQNPLTITKYSGYNPEVSSYHNALTPGVDYFNYPVAQVYSLGFNVTF